MKNVQGQQRHFFGIMCSTGMANALVAKKS